MVYGKGSRELQDRYNARKAADAIAGVTVLDSFKDDVFGYRGFIENATHFFLATAGEDFTDCSFKGGPAGFVRIVDAKTLLFPDYDGNRMYRSLGNIVENPQIGMLFIKFEAEQDNPYLRVRVNGQATLSDTHPQMASFPGAKRMVEVSLDAVYLNCPRYIPHLETIADSQHIPKVGEDQPEPDWKKKPGIREALEGSR